MANTDKRDQDKQQQDERKRQEQQRQEQRSGRMAGRAAKPARAIKLATATQDTAATAETFGCLVLAGKEKPPRLAQRGLTARSAMAEIAPGTGIRW